MALRCRERAPSTTSFASFRVSNAPQQKVWLARAKSANNGLMHRGNGVVIRIVGATHGQRKNQHIPEPKGTMYRNY